jgi:hypothetical protein
VSAEITHVVRNSEITLTQISVGLGPQVVAEIHLGKLSARNGPFELTLECERQSFAGDVCGDRCGPRCHVLVEPGGIAFDLIPIFFHERGGIGLLHGLDEALLKP